MYLNSKTGLTTIAMLMTVAIGIGNGAAFADSADNNNEKSQMNHEQMMNSDGEQMQMPMEECSDNPDAQMNHEQMMNSDGEQMSMQQCSNGSNAEMNHEQMMNSDGEQMQMPNDDAPLPEN
jgi:hypothetical protein